MPSRHNIFAALGLVLMAGCQSITGPATPTLTRTGQVQDVVIRENLSPATLTVRPGDEVRWVNQRQGAASVVFLDPVMDALTCERNFGSFIKRTNRHQYTAQLSSKDSASVCFGSSAVIRYVVRASSADDPGGEVNIPGTIRIATAGEEDLRLSAAALRRERDQLRSRSQDLERRLQTALRDREEVDKAKAAALAELSALETETQRLSAALQEAENATLEFQSQLTAERGRVRGLQDDKQTLLGDIAAAKQELTRLQQRADELETEAARVRDLEERLSERDAQLVALRQEAGDHQAAAARAALLAGDVERERQQIAAMSAELATLDKESTAVREERRRLSGELEQMQRSLSAGQAERVRLEEEQRDMAARLSEAQERLRAEEGERVRLAEERQALTSDLRRAQERLRTEEGERVRLAEERQALTSDLTQAQERLRAEEAERTRLSEERAAKDAEMSRVTPTPDELTKSLQAEIDKGDVKISQARDRLSIHVVDRILFESGQARLKPAGLQVLKQVSDVLRNATDKHIRIEGHTDNVPIGGRLRSRFPTNWELSTARATSVVHYLIEEGGVDRRMLEAGGYADTRPLENNDTEAGKAANRRIEIVLYPKELVEIVQQVP